MGRGSTPQAAIRAELMRPRPAAGLVALDSVRFVKERRTATRRVVFVRYRAVHSRERLQPRELEHHLTFDVVPADGGAWETRDSTGGAGEVPWSEPTVSLGGGGWPDGFSAGGTVTAAGHEITHVELRFGNGVVLSDTVDDGVVVFATDDHVEEPTTAVLLDAGGAEVRAHAVLPGPPLG
jgi:hypothetical protein